MKHLFVVIRSHGPASDRTKPLDAQTNWRGHAEFMDALEAEGAVILAGPFEGTDDAILVMRATDGTAAALTTKLARQTVRRGARLVWLAPGAHETERIYARARFVRASEQLHISKTLA